MTKLRKNGFRLTVGDVTFVLADSYGFCWGVERAVAMAYEARNFFPDKSIWCTNEIIHNPSVNAKLQAVIVATDVRAGSGLGAFWVLGSRGAVPPPSACSITRSPPALGMMPWSRHIPGRWRKIESTEQNKRTLEFGWAAKCAGRKSA